MWHYNWAPSSNRNMSATDGTSVIQRDTAYDVLLQWNYWQVSFLLRHCTAFGFSQVYWFYVTRVTLRFMSARTLVDLRRCVACLLVMHSAPWSLIQRWRRLLRSCSEFHTTKDTRHRQIFYFTVKLPVRELRFVATEKKRCWYKRKLRNICNYIVARPRGSTFLLPESVIGHDREADRPPRYLSVYLPNC